MGLSRLRRRDRAFALPGVVLFGTGLLVALLLGSRAPGARAHPMPHSVVTLTVQDQLILATMELPFDDLRLATELVLAEDGVTEGEFQALRDYLVEHLRVVSESGAWEVTVGELSVVEAEQAWTGSYRELVAQLELVPPRIEELRSFTLHDQVIIHQVITHTILVLVGDDWAAGELHGTPRELGVIAVNTASGEIPPLPVELDSGSTWAGFLGMLRLGGAHILQGSDHLLFLLVLLLPAPLLAVGPRWTREAGVRRSALRILGITLAFTVGHSATLALSALMRLEVPAAPVEALIAGSILVGAVHAIRPLFPGREALVAGLFGLVHGMAFSFALAELGLSTPQLIVSLLGFNLGIELLQLAVVLAVLPALVVLAPWRGYPMLRVILAAVTAVCALVWLLDRLGFANPMADFADALGAHGAWAIVSLWLLALVVGLRRRGAVPPAEELSCSESEQVPG